MLDPKLKVPAKVTIVTASALIAALKANLSPTEQKAARVLTAQQCHESGAKRVKDGTDFFLKAAVNFNMGGVKALGWTGAWHEVATTEVIQRSELNKTLSRGNAEVAHDQGELFVLVRFRPPAPECQFRAYGSLEEAVADYMKLLRRRFGDALAAASAGETDVFVAALKKKGYFTGSLEEYKKSVAWYYKELSGYDGPTVEAQIQTELVHKGYKLDIDGKLGPKSKAAILDAIKQTTDKV